MRLTKLAHDPTDFHPWQDMSWQLVWQYDCGGCGHAWTQEGDFSAPSPECCPACGEWRHMSGGHIYRDWAEAAVEKAARAKEIQGERNHD